MGAFYSLGLSEGTTVHHNLFHDIESFDYGGWGIYFDEGSTGAVAENNIVYNTKTGGFHQHYGENNVLRNNVFAFAREQQLQRSKIEPHLSFTFERNIVYWRPGEGPLFSNKNNWTPEIKKGQRMNVYTGKQQFAPTDWSGATLKMDYNCYWDGGKEPVEFGKWTRKEWREMGQDAHSIFADPMFVAPEKGDFRLSPETPTKEIGFVPIDLSGVGRQTASRAGRAPAEMPRAFPPAVKPPPMPIEDDFEESAVGEAPAGANVNDEGGKKASIKVTDETAASGKHSLKFTDAAGLQQRYSPHLFYATKYQGGVVHGSFALRVDAGASVQQEWRDIARPYHVGPSIRIDAGKDGAAKLTAHGKPLMELPVGKWARFEIACRLGDDADGRYDLTVTLPGKEPRRFGGLPCDGKFKSLYWFGFMSQADAAAVYYLDDLAIVPEGR
jgi:parallel beta-helix repeat protein